LNQSVNSEIYNVFSLSVTIPTNFDRNRIINKEDVVTLMLRTCVYICSKVFIYIHTYVFVFGSRLTLFYNLKICALDNGYFFCYKTIYVYVHAWPDAVY